MAWAGYPQLLLSHVQNGNNRSVSHLWFVLRFQHLNRIHGKCYSRAWGLSLLILMFGVTWACFLFIKEKTEALEQ